jgi:sugar phosphate permease
MGIIGLVFVVAYIVVLRPIRQQVVNTNAKVQPKIPWSHVLTNKMIWQFFVVVFGLSIVTKGLDTWMPTYLLQARHIHLAGVAWMVPLPSVAAGIGAILSGLIMVGFFKNKEKWLIAIASLLATAFMFGMYRSSSLFAVIAFEVLTYFLNQSPLVAVLPFLRHS